MSGAAHDQSTWNSLYLVAKEAFEKNELDQVEEKCKACVEAAQQLDNDPGLVAVSLQILGEAYKIHGRFREAESVVGQAYTIYEQEGGLYSESTLDALLTLAELDVLQKRFARAESRYKQVLDIAHCLEITEPKKLAAIYENLAICLPEGRERERERFLKYSLNLYQTVEPDDPARGGTYFNLGESLFIQNKHQEAQNFYQTALDCYQRNDTRDSLSLAQAWRRLAECFEWQEHFQEAESGYKRALDVLSKEVRPESLLLAAICEQLAYCCERQEHLEEAEDFSRRALEIYETELGPADIQSATSMHALANLCSNQGKYASAELLLKRACAIYEATYGAKHSVVAGAYECMAAIFESQKDFDKAVELHEKSVTIYRHCNDSMPQELWSALLALACCLYELHRDAESESILKEALDIEVHHAFETQEARTELVALYEAQGRQKEAKLLGQGAHRHLEGARQKEEDEADHPDAKYWKEVASARAQYFESLIGPLPTESVALRNLRGVWTGKLIQFWGRRLNDVWVTSSFGLTNCDMPTRFRSEETKKERAETTNYINITATQTVKERDPLILPPELAGYGYEILLLTDCEEIWPIYFLNMVVPCEILHDIELLRQVRKFEGLTIEAANIYGVGELHFLVMPATGRLPSKLELPNGEMHLLIATRITRAEMEYGNKYGRRALLEQLTKAGLGQMSIVDRPSIL
jgi:tetratricopeptide (TPR) repeat protein